MTSPWPKMRFSDAVEINPRLAVDRGKSAPFVEMAALPIETRNILIFRVKPVNGGSSRFVNGDILFARITPCMENGKTGLVGGLAEGEVATGSTEFIVLRPRPNLTLSEFTYYLAKNPKFRSFAASRMTGTSGRQRVPVNTFDEFEIGVPPLAEQHKIAVILSSVDDAIEKTQAVIEQVQVVKRGLMQQLLTLPAGYAEPGWKKRRLRDCAWVNPEQLTSRTKPSFLMEYIDIAAIERPGIIGRTQTFQFADAPSRARRLARKGDILISTVRPYLRNFARIREAPDNLVVSTGYAVIRPKDVVDGDFLYQQILSASFVKFLKSRMSGSNYPAVAASDVEAYPISLPPLAQQRKFGATLSSLDDAVAKMRTVINRVSGVKEALMSVLLTGELRVTLDTESA